MITGAQQSANKSLQKKKMFVGHSWCSSELWVKTS